jgi:pantoate kinase
MREAIAFVPGHISGFFQVCDEALEPERRGSRNCGPCITAGVLTEVRVEPHSKGKVRVYINGEKTSSAETTMNAAEQVLRMAEGKFRVDIYHKSQVPIGAGYGASGAGAFGAALALSKALKLGLSLDRVAAVAHRAEVECGTGLGDVGAQAIGGLVIGLEPGSPNFGRWSQIPVERDIKIVCSTIGPLLTKEILKDEGMRARSKELGGQALRRLLAEPTPKRFMEVSYEFARRIGLMDDEVEGLIKSALRSGAIGASMVMLGRAVFAMVKEGLEAKVRDAFLELVEPEDVMVVGVDGRGAREIAGNQ